MPCGSSKDSNQHDKNAENGHCAFQDLDHSVLQHSLNLGVTNIQQILRCVQSGSKEVKDIILNECNFIYECKVCANLFRSLANFLYHKRCYCKKHLCEGMLLFENFDETEPVVIQPEPPDKEPTKENNLSHMTNCTVNLEKADLLAGKKVDTISEDMEISLPEPREKAGKGKVNKSKEVTEDESKKGAKPNRTTSPMMSRRTREKNSVNANKRPLKSSVEPEPPKKSSKSINKASATSKNTTHAIEEVEKDTENNIMENRVQKKGQTESAKLKEVIKVKEFKPVKVKEIEKVKEAVKVEEHVTGNESSNELCNKMDIAEENETQLEVIEEELGTRAGVSESKEIAQVSQQTENSTGNAVNSDVSNLKTAKQMYVKPLKKIIIHKPKSVDLKSSVLDNICKSMKANKLGFTNITNASGKNLQCLPKIIFKTIDGNPHAVFQSTDGTKSENISFKGKVETSKADNEKMIIVLKKDPIVTPVNDQKPASKKQAPAKATSEKQAPAKAFSEKQPPAKATSEKQASVKAASEKQASVKAVSEKPPNAKAVSEKPANAKATSEKQAPAKQISEKHAPAKPISEKQATEKQGPVQPVSEKQVPEKLAPEKYSKTQKNQNEFHLTRRKRLLQRSDCNVQELKCLTCNAQFTSLKTLYFHMLSIHSKKRLYYPCPFCKTLFVQMYGVTRHLIAIHNKTKEQINKLRETIKKRSVWKKVDDVNIEADEIVICETKASKVTKALLPKPKAKPEKPLPKPEPTSSSSENTPKTVRSIKEPILHMCSKCGRAFGRKSSQVSHEKFCIMNAIKVETVDLTGGAPISPPPNVSFLSLSPKKVDPDQFQPPIQQQKPSDIKVSTRPKRGAEKQMHKDFVDSQTLKWRSANTSSKATTSVKKTIAKNIEKKVLNIMNVDTLLCTKCDKTFSSYSNLRRHVAIHVGWTRFKCKHCDYQAYNKSQCWAHVQKAHAVREEDLYSSVVNIGKSPIKRSSLPEVPVVDMNKELPDVKAKRLSLNANGVSKVKITKKGMPVLGAKTEVEKKKGILSKKEKSQYLENNKEVYGRSMSLENKKDTSAPKKEKSLVTENKKDFSIKKEKSQIIEVRKDTQVVKQDKVQNMETDQDAVKNEKPDSSDKKERSQSLGPIIKFNVPQLKKEPGNYKSVTTNNPTTIILSKNVSATQPVQSILAIAPETLSSSAGKTFPLRSSPRKGDGKGPEENSLTSLVTRSSAYTKSGPITIKMPGRSNSTEERQKSPPVTQEKAYTKKDKLISEWFPKKDINSNARRESAPLIIGLVPAANPPASPRAKSPAFSYERSQN